MATAVQASTPGLATSIDSAWATPIDKSINLHRMTPTLYRSALPVSQSVPLLQSLQVQTVVSFIKQDDAVWLGDAPMTLVSIPLHADRVNDADVLRVLRTLQAAQLKGPVLMHCKHGRNRTGLMAAMYRTVVQDWSKEDALKELQEGGYGDPEHLIQATRYVMRSDIAQLRQALVRGDCSTSRFATCRVRSWLSAG
ncbi:tyrosine-protein phosphatase [Pseudomonas sp. MDT1-17]